MTRRPAGQGVSELVYLPEARLEPFEALMKELGPCIPHDSF